jgi:hypothetical protein
VYKPDLVLDKNNIIWPDVERLGLQAVFNTLRPGEDCPAEISRSVNVEDFLQIDKQELSTPPAKTIWDYLQKVKASYESADIKPLHHLSCSVMKTLTFKELRMSIEQWSAFNSTADKYNTKDLGEFTSAPGESSVAEQIFSVATEAGKTGIWLEVKRVMQDKFDEEAKQASGEFDENIFIFKVKTYGSCMFYCSQKSSCIFVCYQLSFMMYVLLVFGHSFFSFCFVDVW